MNPVCRFHALCRIQTGSEVEIKKGFNAKTLAIQRIPKYFFPPKETT